MFGFKTACFVEKLDQVLKVEIGLLHHLDNVVLRAVQFSNCIKEFLRYNVLIRVFVAILSPEFKLAVQDIPQYLRILFLPTFEPLLFWFRFAMNFKKGQELLKQTVAGHLEGADGAFKAL